MNSSSQNSATPPHCKGTGAGENAPSHETPALSQAGTPGWVSVLFPEGKHLVYALSLAGKRYATQWTVYRGPRDAGLHEIEFFLELDPVAMGLGGELVKQRSVLLCDAALGPVHYASEASGTRWELQFGLADVKATLPDGSVQAVPREGAQFLAADNVPAHKALLFAELHGRRLLDHEVTVGLFLANRLANVPYQISPAPDLSGDSESGYRSSHLEEIHLDARGLLTEGAVPAQGIKGWLVLPAPPLPEWPAVERLTKTPLHYIPPANARFRLLDVAIPGPVTELGATLSVPSGPGPFPAALFISGSGTHDRHGIAGEIDMGTHEIMDYLAERGLLGLRFDSRGAGTTKMGDDALVHGIDADIADARACLEFLRARPEAAGRRVFLLGHSQGGTEALAIAAQDGAAVPGVVLMATMGRTIQEVIISQIGAMGKTLGLTEEQVAQQIQEFQEAVQLVEAGEEWDPEKIPHHILAMFPSPVWLKQFLAYRAAQLIARLKCQVLVCQGGKDFQVSPQLDAERIVAAAREAGVPCTYALFPQLDHLFKPTEVESTVAQYYDQTRHVDPEFLARLAVWLIEQSAEARAHGA
jgi:uncharacterized protein